MKTLNIWRKWFHKSVRKIVGEFDISRKSIRLIWENIYACTYLDNDDFFATPVQAYLNMLDFAKFDPKIYRVPHNWRWDSGLWVLLNWHRNVEKNFSKLKRIRQSDSKAQRCSLFCLDIRGLAHQKFVLEEQILNKKYSLAVSSIFFWKNKWWILHYDNTPSCKASSVRECKIKKRIKD